MPAPAIKEEYAEDADGSRQIKEEAVVVLVVPKLDVQNKIGLSRMIKNSGQAMTRDEKREDRRRRRSGEVLEEVRAKEEVKILRLEPLLVEILLQQKLRWKSRWFSLRKEVTKTKSWCW